MNEEKRSKPLRHSLLTFAAVLVILIVYAYGFQVTEEGFQDNESGRWHVGARATF